MLVRVTMAGTSPVVIFSNADNVDITPNGALRVSTNGSKDKPLLSQVGGVAAGLWSYYEVLDDAAVAQDSGVDTTDDGEVTPS